MSELYEDHQQWDRNWYTKIEEHIQDLNNRISTLVAARDNAAMELEDEHRRRIAVEDLNARLSADYAEAEGELAWRGEEIARLNAEILRLSAELEGSVTPTREWELLHENIFQSAAGWTLREENQNNDSSRNLRRNVIFNNGTMRILGKQESVGSGSSARNFTTGDACAQHLPLPNHFAVSFEARLPRFESGIWPCPGWFRPMNNRLADGEIDILEVFGAHKWAGATLHEGYGPSDVRYHGPRWDWTTQEDPEGWHSYGIEKTPGKIKMHFGEREWTFTREEAPAAFDWDRALENPQMEWYYRATMQLGMGSRPGNVGEPILPFTYCDMEIRNYKSYKYVG